MGALCRDDSVVSLLALVDGREHVPRNGLRSSFAALAIVAIALVPIALAEGGTPPSNTVKPALSGIAKDGQTLSTTDGTWSGTSPFTFSYQWLRCDPVTWVCPAIAGASASSYTLTSADVGFKIQSSVTATNAAGQATAKSYASAVVSAAAPSNTAKPALSGTAKEGQVLSTADGTWTGTAPITFSYQWLRCDPVTWVCPAIAGATRFQLHADRGRRRLQDPVVGDGHERCRTSDCEELRQCGRERRGAFKHGEARLVRNGEGRPGLVDDRRHMDRHRADHVLLPVAAL